MSFCVFLDRTEGLYTNGETVRTILEPTIFSSDADWGIFVFSKSSMTAHSEASGILFNSLTFRALSIVPFDFLVLFTNALSPRIANSGGLIVSSPNDGQYRPETYATLLSCQLPVTFRAAWMTSSLTFHTNSFVTYTSCVNAWKYAFRISSSSKLTHFNLASSVTPNTLRSA